MAAGCVNQQEICRGPVFTPERSASAPFVGRWVILDSHHLTDQTAPLIARKLSSLPGWHDGRKRFRPGQFPTTVNLGAYATGESLHERLGRSVEESRRLLTIALGGRGFWVGRSTMLPVHEDRVHDHGYFVDEITHHAALFADSERSTGPQAFVTLFDKRDVTDGPEIVGTGVFLKSYDEAPQWIPFEP